MITSVGTVTRSMTRKRGHKKGCTAIPVRQRTPLQNTLIEHRADKASDGKPFCVSYNIARHTLKRITKRQNRLVATLTAYAGVEESVEGIAVTAMDISKFSSRNEESDGDEESNGP